VSQSGYYFPQKHKGHKEISIDSEPLCFSCPFVPTGRFVDIFIVLKSIHYPFIINRAKFIPPVINQPHGIDYCLAKSNEK